MYLFVCALCMFINGVLAAGAKLKSIRYNTQYLSLIHISEPTRPY